MPKRKKPQLSSISLDPADILKRFQESEGKEKILAIIFEELYNASPSTPDPTYLRVMESMYYAGAAAVIQMASFANSTRDIELFGLIMSEIQRECDSYTNIALASSTTFSDSVN